MRLLSFIMLLWMLLLVPLAYAQGSTSSIFSINSEAQIYANCPGNSINLSVIDPNGDIILNNVSMSAYYAAWNYSFILGDKTGVYLAYTYCSNGEVGYSDFQVINVEEEIDKMAVIQLLIFLGFPILFWIIALRYEKPIFKIFALAWLVGHLVMISRLIFDGWFSMGVAFVAIIVTYLIWDSIQDYREQ